jgi:hypothetical protein
MNYNELQDMKDLLETIYPNLSRMNIVLRSRVRKTLKAIKREMRDMDNYISQMEEEAKYGQRSYD